MWNKGKAAGSETIGALVLLGIIFSHHDMIEALREARTGPFRGTINKGKVLDTKAFTNTANNIEELGYSVSHTETQVSYNFTKLFEIPGLNKLALELIALKFRAIEWDGKTNLVDGLVARKLNDVFSISEEQFRNWLTTGNIDAIGDTLEDEEYFLDTGDDTGPAGPFVFSPGHTPKKTGTVAVSAPTTGTMASLLHNELQSALYEADKAGLICRCTTSKSTCSHPRGFTSPAYAPTIIGRGREARKNGPNDLSAQTSSNPNHYGSPVLSTAAAHPEGGRGRVGAYAGPLRQERYAVTAVLPRGRLQCACRCASRKSLIVGPAARR